MGFFKNAKIVIEDLLYVIFMVSKIDIEVVSVLIVMPYPCKRSEGTFAPFLL